MLTMRRRKLIREAPALATMVVVKRIDFRGRRVADAMMKGVIVNTKRKERRQEENSNTVMPDKVDSDVRLMLSEPKLGGFFLRWPT